MRPTRLAKRRMRKRRQIYSEMSQERLVLLLEMILLLLLVDLLTEISINNSCNRKEGEPWEPRAISLPMNIISSPILTRFINTTHIMVLDVASDMNL